MSFSLVPIAIPTAIRILSIRPIGPDCYVRPVRLLNEAERGPFLFELANCDPSLGVQIRFILARNSITHCGSKVARLLCR